MEVKNCRRCRRLFNYMSGQQICPACKEEIEVEFQKVKAYIQENRNATIKDVSEACEVEESQIRQWVREERLMFADGVGGITCETCGALISTGRFCEKCKVAMINSFSAAGRRPEAPKPAVQDIRRSAENKMRFLNK